MYTKLSSWNYLTAFFSYSCKQFIIWGPLGLFYFFSLISFHLCIIFRVWIFSFHFHFAVFILGLKSKLCFVWLVSYLVSSLFLNLPTFCWQVFSYRLLFFHWSFALFGKFKLMADNFFLWLLFWKFFWTNYLVVFLLQNLKTHKKTWPIKYGCSTLVWMFHQKNSWI